MDRDNGKDQIKLRVKKRRKPNARLYPDAPDIGAYNTIDGKPPVQLYQYQEDYLRNMPAKYIMAADTGTGKTIMALTHYDRHAYLKPLLILAPASKINTGDWERELGEYFAGRIQPHVEYYSYEKFSRATSKKQYAATSSRGIWADWLKRYPSGFSVIADEVHRAKNPQSLTGKTLWTVTQSADTFIGLSATPLPNGWIDAMNYFKIFGLVKNKTAFKDKYVDEVRYRGFPEIKGYKLIPELERMWNGIAKPLDKSQALDLPPLTYIPVRLESGKEYRKVQKERVYMGEFLDNPSALMNALRQSIVEPKVEWLEDFLEGVSDNVVVFYNYKSEYAQIMEMLKAKKFAGRKVYSQNGDKHEVPHRMDWPRKGDRTITLAQYQSGSTGIELTYAATTVYFSPTYSYSNFEQSIGRTNRNGQTSKMSLYLLCAPDTLERDIWDALRNKTDFQEAQWAKDNT